MTRFCTRRVLNTGAALVALALVTACALPYPGTSAAIAQAGTPSLRTVTGLGGRTSCTKGRALGCAIARTRERAAGRGARVGGGHVLAPPGGESDYTRPAGDALSRGVFIEHLASCARQYPVVRQAPPERVLAVGLHESGLRPLAIHDNTTGLSLYPETLGQAVAMASSLRRAGHRIDAGVMQVSDANWAAYGLTVEGVFDARANICAGARILGEAYLIERRAACRYNTGRPDCANGYPESIDRALDDLRRATPPPGAGTTPPAPAALELEDERLAANSALAGIADIDRAEAQRLLDGIEEVLRRRPRTRGAPDVNAADQTAREVAPELLKEAGGDAVPTMQRARWSY